MKSSHMAGKLLEFSIRKVSEKGRWFVDGVMSSVGASRRVGRGQHWDSPFGHVASPDWVIEGMCQQGSGCPYASQSHYAPIRSVRSLRRHDPHLAYDSACLRTTRRLRLPDR